VYVCVWTKFGIVGWKRGGVHESQRCVFVCMNTEVLIMCVHRHCECAWCMSEGQFVAI
jgi:hypothetical protein